MTEPDARDAAIERIAAERTRQIEREGYTPEHDDTHDDGELALAAACYAARAQQYISWPFADDQPPPGSRIDDLGGSSRDRYPRNP